MGMDSGRILAASSSIHVVPGGPVILLSLAIIRIVIYLAVKGSR